MIDIIDLVVDILLEEIDESPRVTHDFWLDGLCRPCVFPSISIVFGSATTRSLMLLVISFELILDFLVKSFI